MPVIAEKLAQTSKVSPEWQWNGGAWDRRECPRLELRYSLRLRRAGSAREVETETKNVSYSGFYFQSETVFRPQEKVEYAIVMPAIHDKSHKEPVGQVICRGYARVVRVEAPAPEAKFGIACRMEGDYTVSQYEEDGSSLVSHLPVTAHAC